MNSLFNRYMPTSTKYVGTFRWWWLLHSCCWLLFRLFLSYGNLKDTNCVSITREMLSLWLVKQRSAAEVQ